MITNFYKFIIAALLLCSFIPNASCQTAPFYKEIHAFKKQDSSNFPGRNQILFIGSSSFTKWTDIQDYFPGYPILNRAFGGSTLPDLIRYRYEILYAYQPKQVFIYCGENDFADDDTVTVTTVVNRFATLFNLIRSRYKSVPVVYVSMKPSPSRVHLLPKFREANERIRQYLATQTKATFLDVYQYMLLPDGTVMKDIFLEDQLHMNAKGYAIWKKRIKKVLIK